MSQSHLIYRLLSDCFGPTVAAIGKNLFQRGRSTIVELEESLGEDFKHGKSIRRALFTLIQLNLVTYYITKPPSTAQLQTAIVHYELNGDRVLTILRYPKFIDIANRLLNDLAGKVLLRVLQLGRVKRPAIISASDISNNKEEMERTFQALIEQNILSPLTEESGQTTADLMIENEDYHRQLQDPASLIGQRSSRSRKKDPSDILVKFNKSLPTSIGKKRQMHELEYETQQQAQQQAKRSRMDSDEIYYRANTDRLNVLLRNDFVCQMAKKHFRTEGQQQLMQCIVRLSTTSSYQHCWSTDPLPACSIKQIADAIPTNLPLKIQNPSGQNSNRVTALRYYLDSLTDNSLNFLTKLDESAGGRYHIDIRKFIDNCKQEFIENVILEKFGSNALRLQRALLDKQVFDEKSLAKTCLLHQNETRQLMFGLFKMGMNDMQEIPRSNDRVPARTMFLWRAAQRSPYIIQESIYKTICNLYERKQFETEQRRTLLHKLERTDVKEDPDLLSDDEKAELEKFRRLIRCLDAYILRLDEHVALLRDF